MIVQQTSKINRKKSPFVRLGCVFPNAMAAIWIPLCFLLLIGPFCQASSAQEAKKSTKSREKLKDSRKRFTPLGRFEDKRITESSGVALAGVGHSDQETPAEPAAVWTFNDSGGAATLFRVGFKGHTEATLELRKTKNRDWETMCQYAADGKSYLIVGDVGDNLRKRKTCQIHIVVEPKVEPEFDAGGKLLMQKLKMKPQTYEDGPHNCEAMAYEIDSSQFWFVEKVYVDDRRKTEPGVYVLQDPRTVPSDPKKIHRHVAKRIADFPVRNVTGMAFSPNNQRLVIRDYFGAWLFERAEGKTWLETVKDSKPAPIGLPLQSQGEAICFTSDSQSLLVTSEFAKAILWKVRIGEDSEKKKAPAKEKK
jgi:hypothetical protein